MVTIFTQQEKEAIAAAIEKAEAQTRAEMVVVVTSASDLYSDYVLLYGFLLSGLLGLGLWVSRISTGFPELLAIQVGVIALFYYTPPLRRLCLRCIPRPMLHRRSLQKAQREFCAVYRQLPATAPLVLLGISCAERHAHIISSHAVFEALPDAHWEGIINDFTVHMQSSTMASACEQAIGKIGAILARHFPQNGESYAYSNRVIEV